MRHVDTSVLLLLIGTDKHRIEGWDLIQILGKRRETDRVCVRWVDKEHYEWGHITGL